MSTLSQLFLDAQSRLEDNQSQPEILASFLSLKAKVGQLSLFSDNEEITEMSTSTLVCKIH